MEINNAFKYGLIALGLILCIGLKLYFGNNIIVNAVDNGIETIVKQESGYDITPIINVI